MSTNDLKISKWAASQIIALATLAVVNVVTLVRVNAILTAGVTGNKESIELARQDIRDLARTATIHETRISRLEGSN